MVIICIILAIVVIFLIVFASILSHMCPKCKKIGLEYLGSRNIDTYISTKTVVDEVKNKDGKVIKTIEKTIPITKLRFEKEYKCKYCGHIVKTIGEREL